MNEENGNIIGLKDKLNVPGQGNTGSGDSAEDLSEYTDADESMSAPTEILAEFLSALMLKDYPMALKHCKVILQYEPKNATAMEFYPLIMKKLTTDSDDNNSDSDDNSNHAESENSAGTLSDNSEESEGSYSYTSSDGPDASPQMDYQGNSAISTSADTTHSCSSLEDEEAEFLSKSAQRCLDLGNGNHHTNFTSDSESPSEPLSQQTVTFLRAKALGSCSNKT
ncbi:glutamate-rich protein 2 [Ctenocephalides felis]|uniref:glutamate-rich protein 2 n=1 Tax=Ctenocephalides felis TaxID=7515 RepID=UPI000E6E4EF7|nr:glutamate-rich protein 2 [Ctenocephalides felis]